MRWLVLWMTVSAAWALDLQTQAPSFAHLQSKATESVEINLDGNMLEIAKKLLSVKDPKQAEVKKVLEGVIGIYVRSYEFAKPGEYSAADIEKLREAGKGPGWSQVVNTQSSGPSGESTGVFLKSDGSLVKGVLVVVGEPRELTMVNIVGSIQPEQIGKLASLSGLSALSALEPALEPVLDRAKPKGKGGAK